MKNKRKIVKKNYTNDRKSYTTDHKTYDYQSYKKNKANSSKNNNNASDTKSTKNKNIVTTEKKVNSKTQKRIATKKRRRSTSLIVIIFVLIYTPSLFNWLYGNNISTGIIYSGKIEDSINTNALIVRDEVLIESSIEGKYIPLYEEGEKVAVNSVIATILKESSSSLLDEVNEINKKIISSKKEKNKIFDIFSGDFEKLDKEIGNKIYFFIDDLNNGRIESVKKLKTEINEVIQRKALIIGNEQNDDVYIKSLKEQKEKLERQMEQSIEEKTSPFSGIISYEIDGYEQVLKPDSIKEITPEVFNKIVNDNIQSIEKEYRKASINKPFAKVTKELGCYITFYYDANSTRFLKEGNPVYIRINDINKTILGTVSNIFETQSENNMIVLKIDKYEQELSTLRKLNVDIIKSTYQGLMVPIRSLLDINLTKNTANIVLVKANYASVREVEIEGMNNEYAVIAGKDSKKGISLYDTYIVNPKNIQDGQVISQ